jgi:hypothetical protein
MRTVFYDFNFVGKAAIFSPEHGDSMFPRNIGMYVPTSLQYVTVQNNTVNLTNLRNSDVSCVLISIKLL